MKVIKKTTKLTLLLLSMLTMMSNVTIVTMLPHLSIIFKNVEDIELLSRLMITLPSLSVAFLAPFLGNFVHKIGKKKSAIGALFAFSLFGTAGLYLESIYEILFSRFLFGIAVAVLMIVSTSLVGDYFKNEARHKFMGLQSAFMSFGAIIFIVGGGLLSDISWHYPFGVYFIGIVVLFFAFKYISEDKVGVTITEDDEHLLNHNLWYIYFLAFFLMVIFYVLPTQMPFLMMNVFKVSGTLTGEIIAIAFVFNAVGALTFAKLKKRFTFRQIYIIGMIILAIGFIIIGFVTNIYLFFLTSPIMGFGGGLLMANMTTWMLSVSHHKKRVKSSGYLTSALFFGQFSSPIVTHPLVVYFGVQDFFIATGLIIMICLVLFFVYSKIKK
jgi:MFS family permease